MKTLDLTDHPKDQPVTLPKRGPLDLRYIEADNRQRNLWLISVGLAEIYLRRAGYKVEKGGTP